MAKFQLLDGTKHVGSKFTADVDPFSEKACRDLLISQAAARKIPLGRASLLAWHNGRKAGEYRA